MSTLIIIIIIMWKVLYVDYALTQVYFTHDLIN